MAGLDDRKGDAPCLDIELISAKRISEKIKYLTLVKWDLRFSLVLY